jgi:hypothetical protein
MSAELDTLLDPIDDPKQREVFLRAWAKIGEGDPSSFPVQYALVCLAVANSLKSTAKMGKDFNHEFTNQIAKSKEIHDQIQRASNQANEHSKTAAQLFKQTTETLQKPISETTQVGIEAVISTILDNKYQEFSEASKPLFAATDAAKSESKKLETVLSNLAQSTEKIERVTKHFKDAEAVLKRTNFWNNLQGWGITLLFASAFVVLVTYGSIYAYFENKYANYNAAWEAGLKVVVTKDNKLVLRNVRFYSHEEKRSLPPEKHTAYLDPETPLNE